MAEDGEAATCANFFELSGSEFGDGVADVPEGFVSLELGSENGEVGERFEADVFLDVGLMADVIHVDFINHAASPGLKRGGTITLVRSEVELEVVANSSRKERFHWAPYACSATRTIS